MRGRLWCGALLTCGLTLWCVRGHAVESIRVCIYHLENKAGLGEGEMTFLFQTVLSVFSALPNDRHTVSEAPLAADCDETCALAGATEANLVVFGSIIPFGDGYGIVLKLHEIDTGSLLRSETTGPAGDMAGLLEATREAATTLRRVIAPNLAPEPKRATAPSPPPPLTKKPAGAKKPAPSAVIGNIRVTSTPPGAKIYISRDEEEFGELVGVTRLEKQLLPYTYWVTVSLTDHHIWQRKVVIDPGETEQFNISLAFDYPPNPFKVWGHVAMWTGVALLPFGFVGMYMARDYADDYHSYGDSHYRDQAVKWTKVMWAGLIGSGVLMAAGATLWIVSPGDKVYYERKHGVTVSGAPAGGAFSYTRRF